MMTFEDILKKHKESVDRFVNMYELDEDLYNDLYSLWVSEMPYGTAKARTGDPYNWVSEKLWNALLVKYAKEIHESTQIA